MCILTAIPYNISDFFQADGMANYHLRICSFKLVKYFALRVLRVNTSGYRSYIRYANECTEVMEIIGTINCHHIIRLDAVLVI